MDHSTKMALFDAMAYDPINGIFTWKIRASYRNHIGDQAGFVKCGHRYLHYKGQGYMAHRLAVLYMTDHYPTYEQVVVPIDGDKLNCSWENLKVIDKHERGSRFREMPSHNGTGVIGVSLRKDNGKYLARIKDRKGKHIGLGTFADLEDAITARKDAELRYWN